MVRADEFFRVARRFDQARAAMAANVVQHAYAPRIFEHEHQRLAGDFDRAHVAGLVEIMPEAGEYPVVAKQGLLFERVEIGAGVARVRQAGRFADLALEPTVADTRDEVIADLLQSGGEWIHVMSGQCCFASAQSYC